MPSLKSLFDPNEREIKRHLAVAAAITSLEPELEALDDAALRGRSDDLRKRAQEGEDLDELLIEAFALCREASRRTIGLRHFDVQLVGGIVLHQGRIAEMKTGEGKTLVASLALYLNALAGKGVHLVTVNDYLARRDAGWMGPIYHLLGMSVGINVGSAATYIYDLDFLDETHGDTRLQHLRPVTKGEAYLADITYATNSELAFDYLRDNMARDLAQCAQRPLNYAIVDEVDSILIDEARTPHIISGQSDESTEKYYEYARWAGRLVEGDDYEVDLKHKSASLTEAGIAKMERWTGIRNIYDLENVIEAHQINQALKAKTLFRRDQEYLVKDGEVIIVDEFTGRTMPGRRWSDGLHQAVEAKEGVKVQQEQKTIATITVQNYFRQYEKLAGMTGTALTEAEEFHKIYRLDVVIIPTHRNMVREDSPDVIYKTEKSKFEAVIDEIVEMNKEKRPVLVGTVSVEKSERLSRMLEKRGVTHNVLNAKQHEREAAIVAGAGQPSAVTIATNMAGRGTDILLGGNPAGYFDTILRKHAEHVDFIREMPEQDDADREDKEEAIQQYIADISEEERNAILEQKIRECEVDHKQVVELGGLRIIGTERHESRRIDNQLRGRAGRQGDPGSSRFYLSLEDELMRRFAADRVSKVMEFARMDEDMPLESGLVSRFIEQAQTRVEGYNFDARKNVVEYDDVIAKQREVIYADRRAVLERADLHDRVLSMIRDEVRRVVETYIPGNIVNEEEQLAHAFNALEVWIHVPDEALPENIHAVRKNDLLNKLTELVINHYEERGDQLNKLVEENPGLGIPSIRDLERSYTLQVIDRLWMDHIDSIDVIRNSIHFRSIAQRDPLVEFKNEAFRMFDILKSDIQHHIVDDLLKLLRGNITIKVQQPAPQRKAPRNLRTNVDDIARASGQAKSDGSDGTARRPISGPGARQNGNMRANGAPPAPRPVQANKIGRNDPCPCGSGKKYKKCHGA